MKCMQLLHDFKFLSKKHKEKSQVSEIIYANITHVQ